MYDANNRMKLGAKVRIKGLVKAAKHNGKFGRITKTSAPGEGRRVGVKLECGAVIAIKIENLDEIKKSSIVGPSADATTMTNERTLKRDHGLLRELDGNQDPNVLVL